MKEKVTLLLSCLVASVAFASAAMAPRLDFSVPGSLRVTRGAFRDGATFATLESANDLQQNKEKEDEKNR